LDTNVTATPFPFPPDTLEPEVRRPRRRHRPAQALPIPTGHDDLAAALVQGLTRPVREHAAWGPARSLFWSVLSLGLLPALAWALSFEQFVAAEREQFTRFADWVRRHSIRPEAAALRDHAAAMRVHPLLTAIPAVAAVGVFLVFSSYDVNDLGGVLRNTFLFPIFSQKHRLWEDWSVPFLAWNAGLALAYLSQCLAVFLHRLDVARFVARFNQLAAAEGLSPIRLPKIERIGPGEPAGLVLQLAMFVGPKWLLNAVVLLFFGHAPWGFALALAGAERKHYMETVDPAVRTALAQRVTDLVLLRKRQTPPTLRVFGRCRRDGCGAPLPEGARFCPRCGLTLLHLAAGDSAAHSAGHSAGARR
jgi:hypothetical protein